MEHGLKIGECAQRLGVSAKTIRYYEEVGLLGAPVRNASGYRLYSPQDEERLRFVLGAKALGLGLSDIRDIVDAWASGTQPCGHVSQLLNKKLEELDRRIGELQRFRDELGAYKARVDAQGTADDVPCAHIKGVADGQWNTALPDVQEPLRPGDAGKR
jgi:MerR family copper efflux transcriptional regulator